MQSAVRHVATLSFGAGGKVHALFRALKLMVSPKRKRSSPSTGGKSLISCSGNDDLQKKDEHLLFERKMHQFILRIAYRLF